ncbi:hypothetical protein LTR08_000015 [Meristemomyces frigidus]|nr:hypothetical protein LTR08_000015 [Meristemomyces frigidus]
MRRDIAALVTAVYATETSTPSEDLDAQDRHLLSSLHGAYMRSGAGLQRNADRETLRVASDELSGICTAAQDTFIEPEEGVWFERSELAGIPGRLLATMVEDGTRVQVTFRKDHVTAVMRHAISGDTRRRFTVANWHRLPENVKRLAKAVALRDEIARLLGFEHHGALRTEIRMARSVAHVKAQLEDLHERVRPVAQAETDRLLELKKNDPPNGDASELYEWDKGYYLYKQTRDNLSVDHSLLAEYFEAGHTLHGMLTLFHDLFGIDFEPVVTSVWHDTVVPYQVWDTASEGALDMDTTELWNSTKRRILTTSSGHDPQAWGAGQARFVHMFRHNDAGYFSYPLSMAYAADLFAAAFAKDPMSAAAGRRWRYQVLEPGASRPEMGILKDFLGREPSIQAVLDELGA